MKREGTNEDIIQWAISKSTPSSTPSRGDIKKAWVCGSDRATYIQEEVERRLKETIPQTSQALSESVDLHKFGDNLSAEVTFQTEQGAQPTLADALQNPKLKLALSSSDINLDNFEVVKFRSNSWDVTVKLSHGKEEEDELAQRTNHQFMVEWRIRKPGHLLLALEQIIKRLPEKGLPKAKNPVMSGERMVEVAMFDSHFSLLSWAPETGEDYDLPIARNVWNNGIGQIAERTKKIGGIEYFLFPIGNDFLHINNILGQTPKNRNQLDVDTRFARIVREGCLALRDAIDTLKAIAPVKVIWIPGNHDPQTSFFLLLVLDAFYRNDGRVEIDTSPKPRKIHIYGINMIGFMHGCDIATSKEKALAGLLADEAGDLWASGQYREIHRGHTHKKAELWFAGVDTYGGVVVRTIPSLVGTDYWHFTKGFVATSKTAQYFVWNKTYGLESVNDVHAPASLYSHTYKPEN